MTPSLLILYGSETGTAQDVAENLWRDARRRRMESVRLMPMDDYDIQSLPSERLVLFVVSTSGQGELPSNMRNNWRRLLIRTLPSDLLSEVTFGVFALGDSSYQKYNFAGKKLYRRLLQLGAKPLLDIGLADDQHELGVDGALEPWRKELWKQAGKHLGRPLLFDANIPLLPKYTIQFIDDSLKEEPSTSTFTLTEVVSNERLTSVDHFQDTRLISFSRAAGMSFSPGDVLMIVPRNLPDTIDIAIEALELECRLPLDRPFRLIPTSDSIRLPPAYLIQETTTLGQCLSRLFDLQTIPKRSFLVRLAEVAHNQMEKERLQELASPTGLDDYLDYCQRPRRTLAELLRDFPSTSAGLTLEQLLDLMPTIRPRDFSIASSPTAHPNVIQLLVARVEYSAKRMAAKRRGLCSNFLCDLEIEQKVQVAVRSGTFSLRGWQQPLMLVGAGTGVAPLRSIIAENESHPSYDADPILMFFGCRSEEKDFYFQREWSTYKQLTLFTAFSRDQPNKIYVQHRIKERAEEVWRFLSDENAVILVAGSAGEMPKAVLEALKEVAGRYNQQEHIDVDELERKGRIQFETWS